MRNTLIIIGMLAIVGLVSVPAAAQDENGTLYDQEGTGADGYGTIDATGQGPGGDASSTTNWKYQYGSGSWSGVYRKDGWLEVSTLGDSQIDIECDIEMFYTESFVDNKIYVHLGDPFNATDAQKTAYVTGNFTANNGMYLGTCFTGTSKTEVDMLKDGEGDYTGEIQDAMVGSVDVLGRDISAQAFNIKMAMTWDGGATWNTPVAYGDGASGTVHDTLWWLVNNGDAGSYDLQWKIELKPSADQPDGNYNLDPALVAAPAL